MQFCNASWGSRVSSVCQSYSVWRYRMVINTSKKLPCWWSNAASCLQIQPLLHSLLSFLRFWWLHLNGNGMYTTMIFHLTTGLLDKEGCGPATGVINDWEGLGWTWCKWFSRQGIVCFWQCSPKCIFTWGLRVTVLCRNASLIGDLESLFYIAVFSVLCWGKAWMASLQARS